MPFLKNIQNRAVLKALTLRVSLALGGIIVALLLLELLLRFPLNRLTPVTITNSEVGFTYLPRLSVTQFNGESQKRVDIDINRWSLRDDNWNEVKGSHKVLVLGDSYVAALAVAKEERFTEILEQKFHDGGDSVDVINCGVGGSGPENYLLLLDYCAKVVPPDVVVVTIYSGNDFLTSNAKIVGGGRTNYVVVDGDVIRYSDTAERRQKIKWRVRSIVGKSALARTSQKAWRDIVSSPQAAQEVGTVKGCPFVAQTTNPLLRESFQINEELLVEMNEAAGGKMIVILLPEIRQLDAEDNPTFDGDKCDDHLPERWLETASAKHGIMVLPLLDIFVAHEAAVYWNHLNYEGHRLVAESLYPELVEILR